MIMAGVILYSAATMVAMDNLWHASWARMKISLVLAAIGAALVVAGLI